jgi:branched-chain amino acid transport system permease protein
MTGKWLIGIGIAYAIAAALAPSVLGEGALRFLTECFVVLLMAQMWNLLAGYGGLVSLGHQVFVGLGAYALFITCAQLQILPYWALLSAPIVCALVAAAVAIPLFRLREAYFAIGMWVFAEIVFAIFVKTEWLGGTRGYTLATIGMIDFSHFETILFWIASSAAGVAMVGIYLLLRARFGLGLMSVRDNDRTAAHIGVNVQRNRFIAFVVSAAGCGFAGAVFFLGSLFVGPPQAFDVTWVVNMLFIVIIGGIGTIEGPIIGLIIFFGLRELVTDVLGLSGGWYLVTLGIAAVISMLFAPRGLWPLTSEYFGIELLSVRRQPPVPAAARPGSDTAPVAGRAEATGES